MSSDPRQVAEAARIAQQARDEADRARELAGRARDEATVAATEAHHDAEEAHHDAEEAHHDAERAHHDAEEVEAARIGAVGAVVGEPRPSEDGDELAEELLRDYEPGRGRNAFGRPGRPLARQSPFYLGFFGGLGVLVAIWLANVVAAARSVLVLAVISLVIAVGLNPVVEALIVRGVRRTWAVLVVSLCAVVLITLFVISIVPVLTDQVTTIADSAPDWLDQLRRNETIRDLNEQYGVIDRVQAQLSSSALADQAFGGLIGVGKIVLSALFSFLTIFILTLYFLSSLPSMKRACYRLVPASRRERVAILGDEVLSRVGSYVAGAFTVAVIAGLTALVFCYFVGLAEFAVALAVVVAITDFIPLVGATIGAVIVSAIGFATRPEIGVACIVFFVIYQQVENYLIYPRVMSSSVDVPGAVIVIAALTGGALLGVVGALLAIPLTAAILLVAREVLMRRQDAV